MAQAASTRLVWLFAVLVGLIGAIGVAWIWSSPHPQRREELSYPTSKFKFASELISTYDYEIASEIMQPLAEAGDINAQVNMALALKWMNIRRTMKEHIASNFDEQLKWWCLAALRGDAEAQNFLGVALYNESKDESTYWLKQAVENGDPNAQDSMARNYHFGIGRLNRLAAKICDGHHIFAAFRAPPPLCY